MITENRHNALIVKRTQSEVNHLNGMWYKAVFVGGDAYIVKDSKMLKTPTELPFRGDASVSK